MLDLTKIPFKQVVFRSSRKGAKITHIIIHQTEGPTAAGAIAWFMNKTCRVSAHYIVDKDGTITQLVKLEDKAWHVANANPFSIGIEHAGIGKNGIKDITAPEWKASTELSAALCKKFNIPVKNILGHKDPWLKQFKNNHQDPSPAWDMNKYRADVQALLNAG